MTRTYDWTHKNIPISFPDMADETMATMVRMLMRTDLDHEAVCVGARDRIMALVKEKADLLAALQELVSKIDDAGWHKSETEAARNAIAKALGTKGE